MTKESKSIQAPKLIYGEGKDEKNFFEGLISDLDLQDTYELRNYRGQDKLRNDLPALVDTPGFDELEGLIITQDADESPEDTFDSVQDAIQEVEERDLPVPNDPFEIEDGSPSISVFVLPDGHREGSLETLCIDSVHTESEEVFSCVSEFIDCLDETEDGLTGNLEKAKAHAYLASTDHPHSSVGYAAKQGYWNFDHEVFDRIREIIREL